MVTRASKKKKHVPVRKHLLKCEGRGRGVEPERRNISKSSAFPGKKFKDDIDRSKLKVVSSRMDRPALSQSRLNRSSSSEARHRGDKSIKILNTAAAVSATDSPPRPPMSASILMDYNAVKKIHVAMGRLEVITLSKRNIFHRLVDQLITRQRTDDGFVRYGCRQCGKMGRLRQHLRNHVEAHHIDAICHSCPDCPARAKTLASLHQHRLKFHV